MRHKWLLAAGLVAGVVSAAERSKSMDEEQLQLLNAAYPGSTVIFDCEGNFSGASGREHVVGVLRSDQSVRRIGIVLERGQWRLHDIDHELSIDKLPLRFHPTPWETKPGSAAPKCNADVHRDRDLSVQGTPLDKPLFALRRGQANACFGTSEQYNNWDCVAYRQGRFHLWYQQEFAD